MHIKSCMNYLKLTVIYSTTELTVTVEQSDAVLFGRYCTLYILYTRISYCVLINASTAIHLKAESALRSAISAMDPKSVCSPVRISITLLVSVVAKVYALSQYFVKDTFF